MSVCAASRESFHVTNAGPVVCGTTLGMKGSCLSVCLCLCLFKWLEQSKCSINAYEMNK